MSTDDALCLRPSCVPPNCLNDVNVCVRNAYTYLFEASLCANMNFVIICAHQGDLDLVSRPNLTGLFLGYVCRCKQETLAESHTSRQRDHSFRSCKLLS